MVSMSAGSISAITGAGVQAAHGIFSAQDGKTTGTFTTVGAGLGFDNGVSGTLFSYYDSIKDFIGLNFNISGTIGLASIAANLNDNFSVVGGSASVNNPGKGFSVTASRTRISNCKYSN